MSNKPQTVAQLFRLHVDEPTARRIEQINDKGLEFRRVLESLKGDPRMLAIARTHFENACLYALHAVVTDDVIER